MNTLYSLAQQQLSKQDHYDFGLRALVSVLKYAGRKKRARPDMPDEEVRVQSVLPLQPSLPLSLSLPVYLQILLLAMKDMNVAKLTAVDLPLFNGITSDLFPGVEMPQLDYGQVIGSTHTCTCPFLFYHAGVKGNRVAADGRVYVFVR